MSDIQRGATFTTGIPDAPSLHTLVDAATILPAFVTAKVSAPPASADAFPYVKSGAFRQCTLAQLIGAFPNGGAANISALRQLGTGAGTAASGDDPRFPSRLIGIRKANGPAPDTVATAADLAIAGASLAGITAIDWKAYSVLSDNLTGNKTYTFVNTGNGRRIVVAIKLNGFVPTFPAILGTLPVLGSGTTCKTYYFVQSPIGITGFCVAS
jgi:hypothetical protein